MCHADDAGLGRGIDDVADVDLTKPDDAGNRRLHLGVVELGLRVIDVRIVGCDLRGKLRHGGALGIQLLPGRELAEPGKALQVKIGGYNAGTDFDQLVVNGQATLDGTLTVTLINGFTANTGDTFPVLSASSASGIFAILAGDGPLFDQLNDGSNLNLVSY